MGIFGRKVRGGAGSNHFSGRMDYPYAGDGAPAAKAPAQTPAPAGPPPSKRYNIQGGGGDYLHVEDVGDNYYSVTRFGASGERQLHAPRAQFGFDAQKKTASWIDSKNPNAYGGRGMDIPISGGPY